MRFAGAVSGSMNIDRKTSSPSWLTNGDTGEAALDALGGPRNVFDPDSRPVLAFSRTLEELRRDCEYLAEHPGTVAPDPRRELNPRRELVSFWKGGA
jgi:hypothetical protein